MPTFTSSEATAEYLVWSTLVAALCLACSDEGHRLGGAQAGGTQHSALRCESGAGLRLFDDMADSDVAFLAVAERAGNWFAFDDQTSGTQYPNSKKNTFELTPLEEPSGERRIAAHTYGSGFSKWGAGIGLELSRDGAYDLSSYSGFTFLAKAEPGSTQVVRFSVADVATTDSGNICVKTEDLCGDHFGADLNLTTEFRRFTFHFHELRQSGWGLPGRAALDVRQVYDMRFQVKEWLKFDFWIDELALICRPPLHD